MVILHGVNNNGYFEVIVEGNALAYTLSLKGAINSYGLTKDQIADLKDGIDVFTTSNQDRFYDLPKPKKRRVPDSVRERYNREWANY